MLVERTEIVVQVGKETAFADAMASTGVPLLANVDGVLSLKFGRGVENPAKFLLLIGWETMASHTAYNTTPACMQVRELMAGYVASATMEHFDLN